jgi:2-(1,2-epoxy-1,2-dihydrophenyl)acetyl-CoA isomerase
MGGKKMKGKDTILDKEGRIAVLTLNRPEKLNAINDEIRNALSPTFQEVENDNNIRALIITGAGRGFCSGADVAIQAARASGKLVDTGRSALLSLVGDFTLAFGKINKPIIAAINGVAAGVGLTLTLCCDIRLASERARFSAIWVKRGLIPDGGATFLLPMVVGMDRAMEMSFTGDIIDAREAERINLVTRVVPHAELMTQAKSLAERITEMPPLTVGMIKKIMWEEARQKMRQALFFESYGQNLVRGTDDQKEAVKAFMEKREPLFKGC